MEVEGQLARPCQEDKTWATEGGKTKPEKPQMREGAHVDGGESHMQRGRLGQQHSVPGASWTLTTNAEMFRMLMTFKRKQNGRMGGLGERSNTVTHLTQDFHWKQHIPQCPLRVLLTALWSSQRDTVSTRAQCLGVFNCSLITYNLSANACRAQGCIYWPEGSEWK